MLDHASGRRRRPPGATVDEGKDHLRYPATMASRRAPVRPVALCPGRDALRRSGKATYTQPGGEGAAASHAGGLHGPLDERRLALGGGTAAALGTPGLYGDDASGVAGRTKTTTLQWVASLWGPGGPKMGPAPTRSSMNDLMELDEESHWSASYATHWRLKHSWSWRGTVC